MSNLSLLRDALKKSNTNTENMLGILTSFEGRLRRLEQTIVPVYNETENLRRRQESIFFNEKKKSLIMSMTDK
jgi:exocyst complex protein 7